jgi:NAD(P)-dependent dehydrogenase (short-subunit alcohol dehydrogenase family)
LGANLILIDLPGAVNDGTIFHKEYKNKISFFECDLESESQRLELISRLNNQFSSLDVLINNAAFMADTNLEGWLSSFENQGIDTWRRALEVNLTAPFHLAQGLMPLLKKAQSPSVVNVASIYGLIGPNWDLYSGTEMGNPAAYAASKGGLIQLTRWMSTTLAPEVRVNAIAPGGVFRNQPDNFVSKYKQRTPLNRMATEDDLKGAIIFLATDLSQYITGQTIVIDGGFSVW